MKRWPLNKAAFWETAPFIRLLLPFAAGIACYYSTAAARIPTAWLLIATCTLLVAYCILALRKTQVAASTAVFALSHAFLLVAGVTTAAFADIQHHRQWYGRHISADAHYLARVSATPLEKETTRKIPVQVIAVVNGNEVKAVTGEAFVFIYKDEHALSLGIGDTLLLPGNWQPIRNAGNPFEFDYAAYCRRNNIWYRQFCEAEDVKIYAWQNPDVVSLTDRAHSWCMAQLEANIKDRKTLGLIQAMVLGDEVNLDDELRQSFSETGIIHIIAISGGNVAIFFLVVSALLGWMKDRKHLWIKYAIALPLVWCYVMMAGASPSAVRAAIMFSLLAFGIMLNKSNNSLNQLFATAFVLLVAEPAWLYALGFQLSFVAVLSLILFYKPVHRLVYVRALIPKRIWRVLAASMAAEILVAPLVIYYFHTFPVMFLVANVQAYMFMGIVLVVGIAIILTSPIHAVSTVLGGLVTILVNLFDKLITRLQRFNPPSFHMFMITGTELVLVYIIIACLAVYMLRAKKQALFTGMGAAVGLLLLFCYGEWQRLHQEKLVVYSVPKADRVELIRGKQYLVLGGDTTSGSKATYATQPAHIGWQAYERDTATASALLRINGKTVLVVEGDQIPLVGHTDYVVLQGAAKVNIAELRQRYSPQLVVLGGAMDRRARAEYSRQFIAAGIKVHNVAEDGAWVLE